MDVYSKVSGATIMLKEEGDKEKESDEDNERSRDHTQGREESLELLSMTS